MDNLKKTGVLYVVATPIGNMGDITYRAVKTLAEVDFVAAEDTRVSGKLLMLLDIKKPFVSYYDHNKKQKGTYILSRIQSGESCALITDAGTPVISDPGAEMVKLCAENGITVVPVPGACAAVTALSACPFRDGRFMFNGFLPENNKARREQLEMLSRLECTVVFYSAPHDVLKDLTSIYEFFGERRVSVCRELTKLNETLVHTTLSQAAAMVKNGIIPEKGEFVIAVGGYDTAAEEKFWASMTVTEHVEYYISLGMSKMDACKAAARDRNISKNKIYGEYVENEDKL